MLTGRNLIGNLFGYFPPYAFCMVKILSTVVLVFIFQSEPSLPTIEITYVDMRIQTRARVNCSEFDSFSEDTVKHRKIKGKRKVIDFLSELRDLEIDNNRTDTDTRAVIVIRYIDHSERICADKFSIYRNGRCFKITDKLKKAIW